jgi:LytS/YehU family sensor histidine kinase
MESLKSKVNSHFFFNTLDSIYSLIITKSAKASETVLNLSDLMRYVVAESDKKWVSLEKEIIILQNYIELEKVKDSFVTLSFETNGILREHEVPPMIFESFVNNAFKYTDFRNNGSVSIKIDCEPGIIQFNCKNTLANNADRALNSTKKGLDNTRNRLNLIYHENYNLDIKEDDGYFSVNLLLKKQL